MKGIVDGKEVRVCTGPMVVNGQHYYVVKDWNWFWDRENLTLVHWQDIEITEWSGTHFEDGVELGKVLGREEYRKELIAEGILDEEPEEEIGDEL